MISEQIERLFCASGYNKTPSNLPEYTFYWHKESLGVTVLFVIDYRDGLYISGDQYAHLKDKVIRFFREKGEEDVHILALIVSSDTEKAKRLCVCDPFGWMIDTQAKRLIIHENQVSDFYGWKTILEDFLISCTDDANDMREAPFKETGKSRLKWEEIRAKNLPWVNIGLVAVNLIVFLICTFTGELLYNKGAFGVMEIIEDKSFYRIFTSMFLHADVQHLFSNMIVLYYVGEIVERKTGHISYALIYFLSGIAGDVFSMGYELLTREYFSSVGASGAVFGIEGALLFLVIMNRGRLEYMTLGRLVFAIAFSLYCGFTATGVNNAAHVGGILTGFAVTAAIMMLRPRAWAGKDRNINEG